MRSSRDCSADEHNPVREVRTQITEPVRDEMIPRDPSTRDTELRGE